MPRGKKRPVCNDSNEPRPSSTDLSQSSSLNPLVLPFLSRMLETCREVLADNMSLVVEEDEETAPRKERDGRQVDRYCWNCHYEIEIEDEEIVCASCPRAFHVACIDACTKFTEEGVCPECELQTISGLPLSSILKGSVISKYILKAIDRCFDHLQIFKSWPDSAENDGLVKIIDIDMIIDNLNNSLPYKKTATFFSDLKWIYHNCCIIYGEKSDMSLAAKKMLLEIKNELLNIESCPECYYNSCFEEGDPSELFIQICEKPHDLVWAKMKGFSYWPAKSLSIVGNKADVRFFGTHDQSHIPASNCFMMSLEHPARKDIMLVSYLDAVRGKKNVPTVKMRYKSTKTAENSCKFSDAMIELARYIQNSEMENGPFVYSPTKTPLVKDFPEKRKRKNKRGRKNSEEIEIILKKGNFGNWAVNSASSSVATTPGTSALKKHLINPSSNASSAVQSLCDDDQFQNEEDLHNICIVNAYSSNSSHSEPELIDITESAFESNNTSDTILSTNSESSRIAINRVFAPRAPSFSVASNLNPVHESPVSDSIMNSDIFRSHIMRTLLTNIVNTVQEITASHEDNGPLVSPNVRPTISSFLVRNTEAVNHIRQKCTDFFGGMLAAFWKASNYSGTAAIFIKELDECNSLEENVKSLRETLDEMKAETNHLRSLEDQMGGDERASSLQKLETLYEQINQRNCKEAFYKEMYENKKRKIDEECANERRELENKLLAVRKALIDERKRISLGINNLNIIKQFLQRQKKEKARKTTRHMQPFSKFNK